MKKLEKLLTHEIDRIKCFLTLSKDKNIEAELSWETQHENQYLILNFSTQGFDNRINEEENFYGLLIDGENFLISNCMLRNHFSYNGILHEWKYLIIELISNPAKDNSYFEFYINFNHLPEWTMFNSYKYKYPKSEQTKYLEKVKILKTIPTIHNLVIDSQEIILSFHVFVSSHGEQYRNYKSEQNVFLKISSDKERDILWFLDKYKKIRDLLTILTGEQLDTINCFFRKKDSTNISSYYNYNYNYLSSHKQDPMGMFEILFPYPQLKDDFTEISKKWFDLTNNEEIYQTIRLLVSNFYLRQYEESIFLNLMQGLEGFHRLKYTGGYLSEKDFKPIRTEINSFIKELDIPKDLAQSIQDRLRYSHHYTLQTRLEELFNSLDSELLNLLLPNIEPEDFIKHIKQTRNNL